MTKTGQHVRHAALERLLSGKDRLIAQGPYPRTVVFGTLCESELEAIAVSKHMYGQAMSQTEKQARMTANCRKTQAVSPQE